MKAENALICFGPPAVDPIIESLIATARSKNWHVRSVLGHDLDWQVHRQLGETLGIILRKLNNTQAGDPLIAALNDHDNDVRYTVAVALGNLGDLRAVDPLTVALNDEDSGVRIAAEAALGMLSKSPA